MTIDLNNPADRIFAFGVVFVAGVVCGLMLALVLHCGTCARSNRG